ncbi:hypothetical protein, unknown function [Leishmania donovani]|uniref:Leucine Rich repeat/Leucine Rich Repeat, putative n=1 Tax=Leishmania donovani TaxID=5661 RepID=E9BGK3_LEIDO|nr:hypothetical protein, unknown function [Leishmania donovani]AYU79073.1 Leucine Rich repeat/Leucine Rich Repeat, putative [Leishmania donovani]CBZ34379.1 hypothetical protein, unknown function [Leishmania donovani]
MGGATSKDRYDRAATTGILTLNTQKVKSWSSVTKALTKLSTLRIITITHNPLRDPVPYAFTALSLWRTLVSLDLSHNGLTCACALGSEAPLSKTHAKEARTRIAAAPVSNAAPSTTRLPLESLNISGNDLHMLPPLLAARFPRLRRLVCTDNKTTLDIPLSLARCIGPSRSLEVVALQRNQLKTFVIADNAVDKPFPALRELLLDQNHLGGTVSLGFAADEEAPTMASLRRISLDEQKGTEPLRRVNAAIFAHCPGLTSLSLQGNCNEEEIHDSLVQSDIYRKWQERQKEVVDKKLHAGGQAELI